MAAGSEGAARMVSLNVWIYGDVSYPSKSNIYGLTD